MNIATSHLIPLSRPDLVGLGVGRRTLGRYVKNPPPGFPHPIYRNGRIYLLSTELDAYRARLAAEGGEQASWVCSGVHHKTKEAGQHGL